MKKGRIVLMVLVIFCWASLAFAAGEADTPGPLKIDGSFQFRYEYTDYPDSTNLMRTDLWLNIYNQFDGNTYFRGILDNETGSDENSNLKVKQAFVARKAGEAEIAAGRFFPTIGKGTLLSAPSMDGGRVSFGTDIKTTLYAVKFYNNKINYTAADVQFKLKPNANMSLAYVADKDQSVYDSIAVGAECKGLGDITLTGEYGINDSDTAKSRSGKSNPYAFFITAKYRGADPLVPGSTGFSVQYKKGVPGFDVMANAAPMFWNAPYEWTNPAGGGSANDLKGFEYGFETTLAPRLIFSAAYGDLETFDGNTSKELLSAQVFYLF